MVDIFVNTIMNYMTCTLLSLYLIESDDKWQIKFQDEFNDREFIDENKWYIKNELSSCDGNYLGQIHCQTNSKKNIRLLNGTLILAAIWENYLDRNFTSPTITANEAFTYGKVEIRAALPKGKMLRPEFHLLAQKYDSWPKDGEIVIMSNIQKRVLEQNIHFTNLSNNEHSFILNEYMSKANLNNFHSYIMEWTQTEISWKFDEIYLRRVTTSSLFNDHYNPFSKPFKLTISLGVGGTVFANDKLTLEDVRGWDCSLLILDYVRIYQQNDTILYQQKDSNNVQSDPVNKSSDDICNFIMPLIRPLKDNPSNNVDFTAIISIFSFSVLLILLPLVIYLIFRVKILRQSNRNSNNFNDKYHEDIREDESYQQPPEESHEYQTIDNEYADNRENPQIYLEITGDNSCIESSA